MLQLPSDQLITTPFCALGTPTTDFVLPPIAGSDSSLIQTQQFGIPPVQAQAQAFGGKPVLRSETNGVLQFYSNVLYFMNQGGQFTYDEDQSTALGGYSEGAILFDFATKSYVISLIDDNTFDFVTTPSYIDGVHWIKLNSLAYPSITDEDGLVSIIGLNGLYVRNASIFNGSSLFSQIAGRGGIIINSIDSHSTYLGSNNTDPSGGFNGLIFDDTVTRPMLKTADELRTDSREIICAQDCVYLENNAGGILTTYKGMGPGKLGEAGTTIMQTILVSSGIIGDNQTFSFFSPFPNKIIGYTAVLGNINTPYYVVEVYPASLSQITVTYSTSVPSGNAAQLSIIAWGY